MSELWASPYFGIALSILAFWAGEKLQKKLKSPFCNPLLIAILIIVIILLVFDIPYDSYNEGGAVINMFLAPATACLAVSIYTKLQLLKENASRFWWAAPRALCPPWAASMCSASCSAWTRP